MDFIFIYAAVLATAIVGFAALSTAPLTQTRLQLVNFTTGFTLGRTAWLFINGFLFFQYAYSVYVVFKQSYSGESDETVEARATAERFQKIYLICVVLSVLAVKFYNGLTKMDSLNAVAAESQAGASASTSATAESRFRPKARTPAASAKPKTKSRRARSQ